MSEFGGEFGSGIEPWQAAFLRTLRPTEPRGLVPTEDGLEGEDD